MELGLYTFANVGGQAGSGSVGPHERLRNLVEEVQLADQVGLDVFGIGEHHRPDFAASAPAVILAAAAARTTRIRLTSAVSVLSSDDPVRVFEQFSTLDLLSSGRAEIMVGRGSFTESFPLFGYDLHDYDELFVEKLDLLLKVAAQGRVTWSGRLRPPITDGGVYPRPFQQPLPIWIAVGGTPQSAARAGAMGLPMALAIVGGQSARFGPLLETYRDAARRAGHDPAKLHTSLNVHGFVGDMNRQAADDYFGPRAAMMDSIGRERGYGPTTREQFDLAIGPDGPLVVGDPEAVAEKIVAGHRAFGHDRLLLHMAIGPMPHAKVMRSIELFGTRVAPLVRREIGAAPPARAAGA